MHGGTRELLVADSGASNNTDTSVTVIDSDGHRAVVCETAGGIFRADAGIVRRPYTGLSPGLALPGPHTLSTGRAVAPTADEEVPRMFLQAGDRAGMRDISDREPRMFLQAGDRAGMLDNIKQRFHFYKVGQH